MLDEEPLPNTAFLKMYMKYDGRRVADNLEKALMLLEDIHFWEDVIDKDLVLNLKWHSIVVSIFPWPFFNDLTQILPFVFYVDHLLSNYRLRSWYIY